MRALRFLSLATALSVSLSVSMLLPATASAQQRQVTVSAAASLTDALRELAPRFEAARPGTTLRMNFAASGVLLQQIVQGAPVDVFASADQETMDRAAARNLLVPDTRRDFATNTLVLIEPAQGGAGLKSLADLNGPAVRRIAIGKPATVPVGRYTRQVLEGAGVWATLEPRFVQADNVRQVLDYVSRGEVEAGFVYATDAAMAGDRVRVVATPAGHQPVRYPVAVIADSRQPELARDFVRFLAGDEARAVLQRHGFGRP